MSNSFKVVVSAGTLRSTVDTVVVFPHRWTPTGVTVEADFTGAHLLHVAAAGCVLNDLYREALPLGVVLDGVRVRASGEFDAQTWQSTGIRYSVEIRTDGSPDDVARLLDIVDEVAEIPRVIRAGAGVRRIP
jgi:uncharacterized OsmC-like protein